MPGLDTQTHMENTGRSTMNVFNQISVHSDIQAHLHILIQFTLGNIYVKMLSSITPFKYFPHHQQKATTSEYLPNSRLSPESMPLPARPAPQKKKCINVNIQ